MMSSMKTNFHDIIQAKYNFRADQILERYRQRGILKRKSYFRSNLLDSEPDEA